MPKLPIAAIFVSPGVKVDGGGFWIDAQGHIHRIPPWNPEALRDIDLAASLYAHADSIKSREIRADLQALAAKLVAAHVGEIQRSVGQAVQIPG
jgi:hypothetical protein